MDKNKQAEALVIDVESTESGEDPNWELPNWTMPYLKLNVNRKRNKNDNRSSDMNFYWVVDTYGEKWEEWRAVFADWIYLNNGSIGQRLDALCWFFVTYLEPNDTFRSMDSFFNLCHRLPKIDEILKDRYQQNNAARKNNLIIDFLNWLIKDKFSNIENGVETPTVGHPYQKMSYENAPKETCKTSLPYKYIRELVDILCPNKRGSFCDWNLTQDEENGDWFTVDPRMIDKKDPDCVWRTTGSKYLHQMWSPVRSVAVYILLNIPLRGFQVRMLDSGEADTWRYENGQWVINKTHKFAGGESNQLTKNGIFRRIKIHEIGVWETGLFINTNKTADLNKELHDKGYVIPWNHEDVLFWLEKLRNWQEKYNPIASPTSWFELTAKHLGSAKSLATLAERGSNCFLFRDPCIAGGRNKPIVKTKVDAAWIKLLETLEEKVYKRGETVGDNGRLKFVYFNKKTKNKKTDFPIHSLRVSLLTHYFLDGQVPLPVLSKLVAGHTRIFMTIYYLSISPNVMRDKMFEAESKMEDNQEESFKSFLKDARLNQIPVKCTYKDQDSVFTALANRNPLGWENRHIGMCLVGGNTMKSDTKSIGSCWNGGEVLGGSKNSSSTIHEAVPNGPENCVRCRWLITNVDYLDALKAHFNVLSYKLSLAVDTSKESAQQVESLEDARYQAELSDIPFVKQNELQIALRRYQKQIVEADEYAKDVRQCFTLICRIISQELKRSKKDNAQKLVAVGTLDDISYPISLIESESELFQLSGICENAEVYPDLQDEILKTPAIEKRSRILNTLLMKDGYKPIFMGMDERMQLIMGNAFMRKMALQVASEDNLIEGLQKVCGYMDTHQSLKDLGLIDDVLAEMEEELPVFQLSTLVDKSLLSKAKGKI